MCLHRLQNVNISLIPSPFFRRKPLGLLGVAWMKTILHHAIEIFFLSTTFLSLPHIVDQNAISTKFFLLLYVCKFNIFSSGFVI